MFGTYRGYSQENFLASSEGMVIGLSSSSAISWFYRQLQDQCRFLTQPVLQYGFRHCSWKLSPKACFSGTPNDSLKCLISFNKFIYLNQPEQILVFTTNTPTIFSFFHFQYPGLAIYNLTFPSQETLIRQYFLQNLHRPLLPPSHK